MGDILRHVRWEYDFSSRGLVGVKVEREMLYLDQLRGEALPVQLLLRVLNAALGEDWPDRFENLYRSTVSLPVAVEVRNRSSGARDYLLRVLENAKFFYAPVCARVHVSMHDKLNEGVEAWMGYLPPLLAKIFTDYPQQLEGGSVQAYEPRRFDFVKPSDAPSGLLEAVEACAVMAAMK